MTARFDIFVLPTLGAEDDKASRLAAAFGIPLDQAAQLLRNAPIRIKKNAALVEAERYQAVLRECGVECERRLIGGDDELPLELDTRPAPEPPAPEPPAAGATAPGTSVAGATEAPIVGQEAAPPPIAAPLSGPNAPPQRGILGTPVTPEEEASIEHQRSRIRRTGALGLLGLLAVAGVAALVYVTCRAPRMGGLVVTRVGPARGGNPTLILLHGYGAPGKDLVPLGEEMLEGHPNLQIIVAEAPFGAGAGHAWYVNDMGEADKSRNKLLRLLEEVAEEGTLPEMIVIAGFSQGGIMAMDAALNSPETLGGVAVLSGGVEEQFEWQRRFETNSRLRVFISHGTSDQVLGHRGMERFAANLRDSGYQVDLLLFGGGHAIPSEARTGLSKFISSVIGE